MTDIIKDGCMEPEGHHHDCNCEGEDCSCEDHCESESNIITLEMEDGSTKDFQVLDTLENEGKHYIALAEVGSMEYDILRFVEIEESLELSIIEDDNEYNTVSELFEEMFLAENDPDMFAIDEDEE